MDKRESAARGRDSWESPEWTGPDRAVEERGTGYCSQGAKGTKGRVTKMSGLYRGKGCGCDSQSYPVTCRA